jgi:lysophospholipase L1-like esterase
VFFLATALFAAQPNASGRAELPGKVKRVVFLGDSITYTGIYVEFVEAYFVTHYPERVIEFVNVGLPSETVSGLTEEGHAGGRFPRPDLHERLGRVLEATKPDLVFACYGMNDGIYLPLADERFQKFRDGIKWLHEEAIKSGAMIVHLTPPTFDEVKGGHKGYNTVLSQYSRWLLSQRAEAGWDVVDLHGPMDSYLAARREKEPKFAYAADGVHAGEIGQWVMAKQILIHLGAKDVMDFEDGAEIVAGRAHGEELLNLVKKRQSVMRDAWLTKIGHARPGMPTGLPFDEAQKTAVTLETKIRGLANDQK